MADPQDVRIKISSEADTRGLDETQKKIQQLRQEAEQLRKSADVYEQKFGPGFAGAQTARADAAAKEREANRLEKPYRETERQARAEAKSEERQLAQTTSERERAEREITRQKREQAAVLRAMASVAGSAALFAAGVAITEISERQGIALRDAAQRAIGARRRSIQTGLRGTSEQVQGDADSLEDAVFEREQNRAELERKVKFAPVSGGLKGAGAGAATGALIGSQILPGWGTVGGAIIGGAIGAIGWGTSERMSAKRDLDENDLTQQRELASLEEKRRLAAIKFNREEGGLELKAQRARIEGNYREAITLDAVAQALTRARQLRAAGASEEQQLEGADMFIRQKGLEATQRLGGLATARDGNSAIASLASLAGNINIGEMREQTRALITTMQAESERNRSAASMERHFRR